LRNFTLRSFFLLTRGPFCSFLFDRLPRGTLIAARRHLAASPDDLSGSALADPRWMPSQERCRQRLRKLAEPHGMGAVEEKSLPALVAKYLRSEANADGPIIFYQPQLCTCMEPDVDVEARIDRMKRTAKDDIIKMAATGGDCDEDAEVAGKKRKKKERAASKRGRPAAASEPHVVRSALGREWVAGYADQVAERPLQAVLDEAFEFIDKHERGKEEAAAEVRGVLVIVSDVYAGICN